MDSSSGAAAALGIQMEQIRRANRLWASDSLFVRETLLVPVPLDGEDGGAGPSVLSPSGFSADSGHSSDSSSQDEPSTSSHSHHQRGGGAILREAVPAAARKGSSTSAVTSGGQGSRRGSLRASVSDQSDSSLSDFLVKIDSSIARTKHQVEKIQGSSQFCSGEDFLSCGSQSRRKPAVSRLRHAQSQGGGATNGSSSSSTSGAGLEVTTAGRKLRSSLQRLEQAQDEIFEL